jgi:uncharacterized protein YecE (DUF72 family)
MAAVYYIGTSGYHYAHWRGVFYPPKLPVSRWLAYYAQHFTTLELNNPFYRLPSEAAFQGWRDATPAGFRFAVKASRFLTHIKRLRDPEAPLALFLQRAQHLGEKLGPLLYQLPPQMHRDDGRLVAFLAALPSGLEHVIEFRHRSWFEDAVFDLLQRHGVGFCVADLQECPTPFVLTADFAYVRFHGSGGTYWGSYSDAELQQWAERLHAVAPRLRAIYAYFNNDAEGAAVHDAQRLMRLVILEQQDE